MKSNFNDKYIKYKTLFSTLTYSQLISKNLVKLFIKVKDRIYFPKFIFYRAYDDDFNGARIKIKRIDNIIHKVRGLTYAKRNEIKS